MSTDAQNRVEIETVGLRAYFGNVRALHGVSLEMPRHQLTALIGPSGCGKSTFIRCLNRLHEEIPGARAEGRVLLEGQDIYRPGSDPVIIRRRIGMVFQRPNPFPAMSIYENVASGLLLAGVRSRSVLDPIVERSLRQAALWDEVKDQLRKPGTRLSGGQQQRLCIARSVAVKPSVILLDEPTSALDPISTAKVEELVHELKADYTVAIVTHNMQQAARVSDFTAYMYLGEMVEFGKTDEIFIKPKKQETEDYITGRFG